MREWSKPASTLLLGFGLWLFCVFIYLSHIPLNYTYDGMVFASHIERDHTPLWDLFHPHHLIYTFLGRLLFLWGKAHGAEWDGLVTLQFFDLMTGSLGILIAFHLMVRETNDRVISALSALGLSFSFSYWYFSTSPGVRIFATVTPLFAWYVLTFQKKARPAFGWWIGFAHGLAVLGHQTNILLIPAFVGGIWLIRGKSLWDKAKITFYYLIALTLSVLGVYGFVGRFACVRLTYASWMWWVFSYFHVQQWGGHLEQAGINQGGFAMVKAFLQENIPLKTMAAPFTFSTAETLLIYALWFLLAALVIRFGSIWKNQKQTVWVAFLWLLAFVPFFIWWEPWNIEFWVSSTVPCWILMGVVVSNLTGLFRQPVLHGANRVLVMGLWAGVVALLFFYNFSALVKNFGMPVAAVEEAKPAVHGHQMLLNAIDWKVEPEDLLVLDGINTIPFYIDRYKKRKYLSLHAFLKRYRQMAKAEDASNKLNLSKNPRFIATPVSLDPWGDLTDIFKQEWKHHHRVWVLTEAVDEKDAWRIRLEKMMDLPQGQLTDFFNGFELKPVIYHKNVYFYELRKQNTTAPQDSNDEDSQKP